MFFISKSSPDHISAIIFPSNTHFQNSNIHPLLNENFQGHHCQEFEVGRHVRLILLNNREPLLHMKDFECFDFFLGVRTEFNFVNFKLFENFHISGFPWCSTREDHSIDVSITNVGLILTKLR